MNNKELEQIGESVWNSYRDIAYLFLEEEPLTPLRKRPWSPQAPDDREREQGNKGAGAPNQKATLWSRFRETIKGLVGRLRRRNGKRPYVRSSPTPGTVT